MQAGTLAESVTSPCALNVTLCDKAAVKSLPLRSHRGLRELLKLVACNASGRYQENCNRTAGGCFWPASAPCLSYRRRDVRELNNVARDMMA